MKKVLYVLHQKTSVAGDVGNKFKNRGFSADIVRKSIEHLKKYLNYIKIHLKISIILGIYRLIY